MPPPIIKTRARFFVAVEGESERSFVTWLQMLSQKTLHIPLDALVLGGGGFKSMLRDAVRLHARRRQNMGGYENRFLIVDEDRASQGDWAIAKLRREAAKHKIIVYVQRPNHEGLLSRMLPGMERKYLNVASAEKVLKSEWPSYRKPMNAHALNRQFSLDDLLRAAGADSGLEILLKKIGFMDLS